MKGREWYNVKFNITDLVQFYSLCAEIFLFKLDMFDRRYVELDVNHTLRMVTAPAQKYIRWIPPNRAKYLRRDSGLKQLFI